MNELLENIEDWFLTNNILSLDEYDYMKDNIMNNDTKPLTDEPHIEYEICEKCGKKLKQQN